jgi:hypothetical protein
MTKKERRREEGSETIQIRQWFGQIAISCLTRSRHHYIYSDY